MFFAILLRKTDLSDSGPKDLYQRILSANRNKVTVYLPYGEHVLWIVSEEDLPDQDVLQLVEVDTGIEKPVNAYQHYYNLIEKLQDPKEQRYLLSLKSRLSYAVSENLAPDGFYFQLEEPVDEASARRKYVYRLLYNRIHCYIIKEDPLLDQLTQPNGLGPLIASSLSLSSMDVPQWYTREMLRDLVDLKEVNMTDKVVMYGPNSGEIYIFYQEEFNITEDIARDLSAEIQGRIRAAINMGLFPRNTPTEIVKTKRLVRTKQNQFIVPYPVPKNISLFKELLRISFTFDSLLKLFWFLLWLMIMPTYAFIEKEMQIFIRPNEIQVNYETKYLPDFIRVISLARISPEFKNRVELYYHEDIPKGKIYLRLFDSENNRPAIIVSDLVGDGLLGEMPVIERSYPADFSLETRIKYDPS